MLHDTRQELDPLRPTDGRGPLRRFDDIDVGDALADLRCLRRQADDLESTLRRLQRQENTVGLPPN
jgi:hypothetical protein